MNSPCALYFIIQNAVIKIRTVLNVSLIQQINNILTSLRDISSFRIAVTESFLHIADSMGQKHKMER